MSLLRSLGTGFVLTCVRCIIGKAAVPGRTYRNIDVFSFESEDMYAWDDLAYILGPGNYRAIWGGNDIEARAA